MKITLKHISPVLDGIKMKMITQRYRPDIDGIRALAVIAVVVYHFFPTALPGGFVGVDIFFVISGFLISGHIFAAIEAGGFSLRGFYVKRIKRIYPSLITVLAACLIFGWFVLFSSEYKVLGNMTAAGASFLANIFLWKTTGYFNTSAENQILLHLWSLGVEEQYYIVWPLFLLIFRRRLASSRIPILAVAGLSFASNIVLLHLRPTATFYLPLTRFWELLIGVVLAHLNLYPRETLVHTSWSSKYASDCKSVAGMSFILASFVLLNRHTLFPGWWALLPTCGTFLLISAGPGSWISRKLLAHPVAAFIGLISYPIYLWHWPLLVYTRILSDGNPTLKVRVALLALTLLLAWLTYRLIERPIRFGSLFSGLSAESVAGALFGVMAVLGVAGLLIGRSGNYLSFRFPGAGYGVQLSSLAEIDPACKAQFGFATDFCEMSDETRPPTIVLLGDSHAIHFYEAMKDHFDRVGENLLALGEGDCPPFYDVNVIVSQQAKKCPAMMDAALDLALEAPSVHAIILSSFSAFDITGYNFGDKSGDRKYLQDTQIPNEHRNETIFREGLRRTLLRVRAAHKKVYFVLDTPEIDFNPISCIVHRPLSLKDHGLRIPCGISRTAVDERQRSTRRVILDELHGFGEATALDPVVVLCDQAACTVGKDGISFYLDRNHLTPAGATYVVERLDWAPQGTQIPR